MAIVPVSLSSLLSTISKSSALETTLEFFKGLGFKVTSWVDGGIGLTTANFLADLVSTKSEIIKKIAAGGYLDDAEDEWLTYLMDQQFDEERVEAIKTQGKMLLTSSDGAPPYTIQPRQLWVKNAAGLLFNNTDGGTLASGDTETLELTWEAEKAGSSYNIPVDSTLSLDTTPLPGVTVTNPDAGAGDWITIPGADKEIDQAGRDRCRLKWATLSFEDPKALYEYWALKAHASVKRVFVDDQNPDGPGTVHVYLAGDSGAITDGPTIATVDAVFQARRGITTQVTTSGATNHVIAITGTVYYKDTDEAGATAAVEAAVQAAFAAIDVGGVVIGTDPGKVFEDAITDAVRTPSEVVKFDKTTPAADTTLEKYECPVPDVSGLVYVAA